MIATANALEMFARSRSEVSPLHLPPISGSVNTLNGPERNQGESHDTTRSPGSVFPGPAGGDGRRRTGGGQAARVRDRFLSPQGGRAENLFGGQPAGRRPRGAARGRRVQKT